jgi:hypothetical protein
MCVQSSSVLRVLQFTPFNVVCYVLHRSVSQVIHGQQLSSFKTIASVKSMAVSGVEEASRLDKTTCPFQQSLHSSSVRLFIGFNTDYTSMHTTSTGRLINQPNQRLTHKSTTPKLAFNLSVMIHPLVHQRIPCYDFYFL